MLRASPSPASLPPTASSARKSACIPSTPADSSPSPVIAAPTIPPPGLPTAPRSCSPPPCRAIPLSTSPTPAAIVPSASLSPPTAPTLLPHGIPKPAKPSPSSAIAAAFLSSIMMNSDGTDTRKTRSARHGLRHRSRLVSQRPASRLLLAPSYRQLRHLHHGRRLPQHPRTHPRFRPQRTSLLGSRRPPHRLRIHPRRLSPDLDHARRRLRSLTSSPPPATTNPPTGPLANMYLTPPPSPYTAGFHQAVGSLADPQFRARHRTNNLEGGLPFAAVAKGRLSRSYAAIFCSTVASRLEFFHSCTLKLLRLSPLLARHSRHSPLVTRRISSRTFSLISLSIPATIYRVTTYPPDPALWWYYRYVQWTQHGISQCLGGHA